ncbi:unnamed protein product [Echinostoma caproni]|uniref:Uncharacterized protein n=1 Tax=Echinostoma caproni TaxID=27848 RepID=A0A3P8GG09_9TREM|nr:unnamed protein product [Echinostoma caproni]
MHTLRWVASSLETASGTVFNLASPNTRRRSFYPTPRRVSMASGPQVNSPFLPSDATPESMCMAVKFLNPPVETGFYEYGSRMKIPRTAIAERVVGQHGEA